MNSQQLDRGIFAAGTALDQVVLVADKKRYAFALDAAGTAGGRSQCARDRAHVVWPASTKNMCRSMITQLAAPEHEADWGMRIISSAAEKYSGGGYHFRLGVASVHGLGFGGRVPVSSRLAGVFQSPRQCAACAGWFSGHLTEVLSGD